MARKGQRWIGGRLYLINGRYYGPDAERLARQDAKQKRQRGMYARIIKLSDWDWAIYSLWRK